jgi:cell division protein ZapE
MTSPITKTAHTELHAAYERRLAQHGWQSDPAQLAAVDALGQLTQRLQTRRRPRLARWLRRQPRPPVRGLYLWGGVGRGKTLLMDLFFEHLPTERKTRRHFHRFMYDVHAELKRLDGERDPLEQVADRMAADAKVLCFDEFFVSDIADAMILGRLLAALFSRGMTLIATSNSPPEELYRDGLQRQRFLPAIALLKRHTHVMHIDAGVDYRLRLLDQASMYLTPANRATRERMRENFYDLAPGIVRNHETIEIAGRPIESIAIAKSVGWFAFEALCEGPRSQNDYIELARRFQTVLISGVPRMGDNDNDAARRFIALVDEFYDRRVKLMLSSDVPLTEIYAGKRLAFEFERTASRLTEMQGHAYLAEAHIP